MTIGRRKTSRLVFLRVLETLRNSAPRPGMALSTGTLFDSRASLSSMSPPRTRILPSATDTVDSIERLLVVGPWVELVLSTDDDSCITVMRISPFGPICGRMCSVTPTSMRSTVWNGLVLLLDDVVYEPVT